MLVTRQELSSRGTFNPPNLSPNEGWTPHKIEGILMMLNTIIKEAKGVMLQNNKTEPTQDKNIPYLAPSGQPLPLGTPPQEVKPVVDVIKLASYFHKLIGSIIEQGKGEITFGEFVSSIDMPLTVFHQYLGMWLDSEMWK